MNKTSFPLPCAKPGEEYIIDRIKNDSAMASNFRGYGIFPGTKIKLLFHSPSKNPSAYEIMDAVLALRHEDSSDIYITPTCSAEQI